MKKVIQTALAPAPVGPYSQAVEANGMVFLSGQIPLNPATNQKVEGDIRVQTRQVMENIKAVLGEAGLDFKHVVKSTIFLLDMKQFAAMNEVYAAYFTELPPARSTVAVRELPKGADVEIEMLAIRS
jgi:2-iminobutanoate/2-iminopropanoate deaminase